VETVIAILMYVVVALTLASVIVGARSAARDGRVTERWANGVSAVFAAACAALIALAHSGFFLLRFGELLSPLFVTYMVLVPLAAMWTWKSRNLAAALEAIPIHRLVAIQTLRIAGGVVVWEYAQGRLPAYFGLTVGLGDILAGVTAPLVALWAYKRRSAWRTVVGLWCAYATADLIHSAIAATLSAKTPIQVLPDIGPALGEPPVVLLVVFLVPVAFIWCVATFRRLAQIADEGAT
jgi:hypothetical protein